ncbi:APC family permease [Rhodococcus wratislaviensis]|uniref:APC family permease n=1 Tax=Rhodococcus wratislaviensis TaxID=44752 RepID=UPI0036697AB2
MPTEELDTTEALPTRAAHAGSLKKGTIGVFGAAVMAIALITPLTTLSSNMAESLILGVGPATVVVTLLVTLLLTFFAAGYSALGRVVVDSGAYAAYAAYGLGHKVGSAVGVAAVLGYNLATVAFIGIGGYFLDNTIKPHGLDLPWWIYSLAILAVVAVLGVLGVNIASRFNTIICGLQFVMLAIFFLAVLFKSPSNFKLDVFSFSGVSGGAFGLSVVFVLLALAGFESSSAYGEEVRDPHRTIPRATYVTLLLLSGIFVVGTWVVVAASHGDPRAVAGGDPGDLVPALFGSYLGEWTSTATNFIIAVTIIGAALAFHNLSTRYMYSSSRSGILFSALSRTHPRYKTPHVAVMAQVLITLVFLLPFVLTGASPMTDLLPAIAGYNALNMITKMGTTSASTIVATSKGKLTGSKYSTIYAPLLAIVGFIATGVLIVLHYKEITGTEALWVNAMPLMIVTCALFGALKQWQIDRDVFAQHRVVESP